jgi:hypothetical protein
MRRLARRIPIAVLLAMSVGAAPAQAGGAEELVAALLGDTPLVRDLQSLTDEVGGRPRAPLQTAGPWSGESPASVRPG